MTAAELKIQIEDLHGLNKTEDAIDLLWKWVSRDCPTFNYLVNLKGQWVEIEEEYHKKLITPDKRSAEKARVRQALIEFPNKLEDKDLKEAGTDKISTRLVLITPSVGSEQAMRLFFPFEYFREVVIYDDKFQTEFDDDDLVIFDNFEHQGISINEQTRQSQIEKLEWVIENTSCFIVWFGNYGEIVKNNNHRIYAANFRFALYARIREMIDFLKYYRGEK